MPRTARQPVEVAAVKQKILDVALDLMLTEGFTALSMRKVAAHSSMTAANIYNYFSNKDEIYLAIQTRGFEMLLERFAVIAQEVMPPLSKIKALIRAYLDFGLQHAGLYEIMFTRNTPKFADYVGTPLEPTAAVEKNTALQLAALAAQVISDLISTRPDLKGLDPAYQTVQLWTALHGIVSLYNSRVLQEADEQYTATMERLAADLLRPFEDGASDSRRKKNRNSKDPNANRRSSNAE